MKTVICLSALSLAITGNAAAGRAQSLERRVTAAGESPAQFQFAARDGICGDGRSFIRADEDGWYGNFSTDGSRTPACERGPVRVVVVRAGRDVVKVETYVGPVPADAGAATNLGAVPAREAAAYLLSLAAVADGRPARDALLPAMLADSAVVTPQLLQIAKDQSRGRDVRRSAISWLARRRAEPGGAGAAAVARTLDLMVRDGTDNESVRQQAMQAFARLDRGEGVPALLGFAADRDRWIARHAFQSLARSGDPRARQFLRDALKRPELDEESRIEAIRGIGGEYATRADLTLLRERYPALDSDRERDAVISAVAQAGGSENVTWLLGVAQARTEPMQRRRRALSLLSRSDDPRVKDALKDLVDHR